MYENKLFLKYKSHEIRGELASSSGRSGTTDRRKLCLKKIIANLTMGNYREMFQLFPDIIQIWRREEDIEIKRMCHQYFCTLGSAKGAEISDVLPIIVADLKSNSEELCIVALRSLSSINDEAFVSEAVANIKHLLSADVTASVTLKKSAINVICKLNQMNHSLVMELYDDLVDMLEYCREDPTVLAATIHVLREIHDTNNDLEDLRVSHNICFNLLENLGKINEWDIGLILNALTTAYVPQTHSEAHHILELVSPKLQNVNTSVALGTLKFILYVLNYVDYIEDRLVRKFSTSIVALLNKPPELQFLVLRNVILLLLTRDEPLITLDPSIFFIEYNDPIYITDTKLEILYLLANEENLTQILDELKEQATAIDIQMSKKALRAIGNLAVKFESGAEYCVDVFMDLLDFGVDYITEEVVSMFKNILRKYPTQFLDVVPSISSYFDSLQDEESRCAAIWIIANHSSHLSNRLEIFKSCIKNFTDESSEVKFLILNSAVKFFAREQSKETEQLCLTLLKDATENSEDPDFRDTAFMYWRLLSLVGSSGETLFTNEVARDIVDGELPMIGINTKLDPSIVMELELNIGSLLSIYLKPASHVFNGCKALSLPESPVLNEDKNSIPIVSKSSLPHSTARPISSPNIRTSSPVKTMEEFDQPAETVNHVKARRKSSLSTNSISTSASKLARKPSMLARKLSIKRPF